MTWAEFKAKVREFLPVDKNRKGVQEFIDAQIRTSVIDLQSHIELYRVGHENTYGVEDLETVRKASKGTLPSQAQILDAYLVSTCFECRRQPLHQYNWGNRFDLECGQLLGCDRAIAISPQGTEFMVHPVVERGSQIEIHWTGLKLEFAEGDATPFDEQMAEAVALRVKAAVTRTIDHDPVNAQDYRLEYERLRTRLYLDARDRNRMRLTEASPLVENRCEATCKEDQESTCNEYYEETKPGESIEWAMLGDSGDPDTIADTEAVSVLVRSFEPDFILHLGDTNYPEGSPTTIHEHLVKWYSTHFPRQWYQAMGNHDYGTDIGVALWGMLPHLQALNSGKFHYKFTKGPVDFFVLNTGGSGADNIPYDSEEGVWLQAALAASTNTWKVVAMHKSPYTSEDLHTPGATALRWPFMDWGADLVVSAHAHVYERLLVAGLPYIVCGLGGGEIRGFSTPVSGSQFRWNTRPAALRAMANQARLQLVLYAVGGEVIDNFTLTK